MRTVLAPTLSLVLASPSMAALSGYWESSKEIHAILGSNDLADKLKQQPIMSIVETETGYRVQSRDCTVDVEVIHKMTKGPGPVPFDIRVGRGVCK